MARQEAKEMSERGFPVSVLETGAKGSDEVFEMYCETCYRDGKHVIASAFCSVCISHLCSRCLDYHGKFLPDHSCLFGDSMPQDVCTEKCQMHPKEILKFQCLTCNNFACSTCKRTCHENTCDLKYLPDVVKHLEQGGEYKQLIFNWNRISRNMVDIDKERQTQVEHVINISTMLRMEIKKEKDSLFDEFDQEAEKVEEEARSVIKSNDERINNVRDKIMSLSQDVGWLINGITQVASSPTRDKYKLFIKMKDINQKLTEIERDFGNLKTPATTEVNALRNKLQKHASDIQKRVHHLGNQARELKVNIKEIGKEPERKVARFLGDIKISSSFDSGSCHIGDCFLLSEHYLIACDKTNSSVKLIDTKAEKVIYVRKIKTVPEAATKISNTEFALVHPYDNDEKRSIIQFLTMTEIKSLEFKMGFILTQMYCTNIAYRENDTFIISMWENHQGKVQVLDIRGKVLATVENNSEGEKLFKCPNYLTLNSTGTVLYVSDWYRDCITEINLEKRAIREIHHRFWHPEGIATDKEGFLYICECGTNRIHVFHPDNDSVITDILIEDNSPHWQPLALSYSLSDTRLYVSQYGLNFIKVFEIAGSV